MSNLENLKKQAKRYLRWHRDRYYPVAARIRTTLRRYRDLSDAEVLVAEFKLADAQDLVARSAGFENWQALRKESQMTDARAPNSGTTTFIGAEPQLCVGDIGASLAFYTQKLGFAVAFSYGDPPFYAQVVRGGARLNLRHAGEPAPAPRDGEQLLAATIIVDEAKPLFLDYGAAGVDLAQPLRDEPWGARTFIVRDPDGNLILFAGSSG